MSKIKFNAEFEINASPKMIYPFLSTPVGLKEWFADDVNINNQNKSFIFLWDNEEHVARLVAHRTNHFVRFEFLPEVEEDEKNPSYFELRLEFNEMTQSLFLKVFDYSDFDDQKELHDLWNGLVELLRKTVGG